MDLKMVLSSLKGFNETLDLNKLNESDQEKLLDVLFLFEDKSPKEIKDFFGSSLNKEEVNVFFNFHQNLNKFKEVISVISSKDKLTNDVLREYFFNNKNLDAVFFSDEYRKVLDYVQTESDLKVKTELFFDLHTYFKFGCFEDDRAHDEEFDKLFTVQKKDFQAIYDAVKKKSSDRDIGVKVVRDPRDGFVTVQVNNDYLSKAGIAKSGFIDRVKITPKGVAIALGTSDGTLNFLSEREQLSEHMQAFELGVRHGKFAKLGYDTTNEVAEVNFYLMTQFNREKYVDLQNKLEGVGICNEQMLFLNSCYSSLLKNPVISDEFKAKAGMEGVVCQGITKEDAADIEGFLHNKLGDLVKNKKEISYMRDNEAFKWIKGYFDNLGEFLVDIYDKVEIKNNTKLIGLINELDDFFPSQFSAKKLSRLYEKERQQEDRELYRADFEKERQELLVRYDGILTDKEKTQHDINEKLIVGYDVKEVTIEKKVRFNHFVEMVRDSLKRKSVRGAREHFAKCEWIGRDLNPERQKKQSLRNIRKMQFSFAERLYVKNNPEFENELEFDYKFGNRGAFFDQARRGNDNCHLEELAKQVLDGVYTNRTAPVKKQ